MEYHHFKMETLKTAIILVSRNCYFASIDLQDAYYSCKVSDNDRKYLRFIWRDTKYQYTCLEMGLASSPRIFTKLMKPVFSTLRKQGHANVAYIDDTLLISETETGCAKNVQPTSNLLDSLGLTINIDKSVFTPTQCIDFLGFEINSKHMMVALTESRAISIRDLCQEIIITQQITIREFARLISKLVASEPGVLYAPLYYKSLEIEKDRHLKACSGNFDAMIEITDEMRNMLRWWIDNVSKHPRFISGVKPFLVIKTDSSLSGWGAINENNGECIQGAWSEDDKNHHINFLELKTGLIAITTFGEPLSNCHIRICLDKYGVCVLY